ncbi:MAG: IclR family transcriptional regulator [Acidimicrobiales bacterium]
MTNGLERGLDAMELLAEHGEAKLVDVVDHLAVSRATAFRVLATLQRRGYVDHVRAAHVYRLGPQMRALASQSGSSSLIRLGGMALADLRNITGETVNMVVLRRGTIAYVAILDGAHALRMAAKVGDEVPAHSTAVGKAILAALPDDERAALAGPEPYHRCTKRTIGRRKDLEADLKRTRERGFAIDDEESEIGAACVAAAVVGADGRPLGAVSVSGLAARMPARTWPELGKMVRARCDAIAAALVDDPDAASGPELVRPRG